MYRYAASKTRSLVGHGNPLHRVSQGSLPRWRVLSREQVLCFASHSNPSIWKHSITKESLCVNAFCNPSAVQEGLGRNESFRSTGIKDEVLAENRTKIRKAADSDEGAASSYRSRQYPKIQEETLLVAELTVCAKQKDLSKGCRLHKDVLERGLLEKNIHIGNALVNLYAKCGALAKALDVFVELRVQDAVSWNALISGYVHQGHDEEALECFERMQQEGFSPDEVTFVCILKACGSIEAADKGKHLHTKIIEERSLKEDTVVGSALVNMYAKCGSLGMAQKAFDELQVRNVASWTALIAGYTQHGQCEEALSCFELMTCEGVSPNAITFVALLKACGSIGSVQKGVEIHSEVVREGLLERNVVLGTALMDMYIKCRALGKAQEVFDDLQVRDVVSWTALIAGYTEHGHGEEALSCFECMQREGLSPNTVTFVCILKACGSIRAVGKGKEIHIQIARMGLLEQDVVVGTALVDMYAKCGALEKAQEVFAKMRVRNVVSWNALIVGYAQHGNYEEALNCFEQMRGHGLSPNAVTFLCILQVCGTTRALDKGKEVHNEICKLGLIAKDILVGNALVDMYAKCGALVRAQEVLDDLQVRDAVTWNALIAGYVQHGLSVKALNGFERMQLEGHSPDAITFACILKACGCTGAIDKGKEIHALIVRKKIYEKDISVGNALVGMYAKCGALKRAQEVFNELPVQDVVSWTALIAGYAQHGHGEEALHCFEQMQHESFSPNAVTFVCLLNACGSIGADDMGQRIHAEVDKEGWLKKDIVVGTALVDMYAKCGKLELARMVFEGLGNRNVVSWNVLIAGYIQHGHGEEALKCLDQMQQEGIFPDSVTFICTLKACGRIGAAEKGKEIHAEIVREGLLEENRWVCTALVDMYAKCGALPKAREVFEELQVRDVVAWNVLIAGYVEHGEVEEAFLCLDRMQLDGFSPDAVTFVCLLQVCGNIGAADKGKELHADIVRRGLLQPGLFVGTAVMDMYGKCGAPEKAQEVFDMLKFCDAVSWTVLIAGYAHFGNHDLVFALFDKMIEQGRRPSLDTFTAIFNACSHSGLLEKGQLYFEIMSTCYGLVPSIEHYACMVDLFARAGLFDGAIAVIKMMPTSDHLPVWTALLGACQNWGNLKLGDIAFERAVQLDEDGPAAYICISNIHAAAL